MEEHKRSLRRRALLITATAIVIVYIIWNVPQLEAILYPFRLFVTYVHEAGHGTMALVSGGQFVEFVVNPDGSGVARTIGGRRLLVLPAGYLGAALFGALLFYLANRLRHGRAISIVLGVGLILFSLAFGRVSPTALLVGIGFGALLIALGWKAGDYINLLILNVLAVMTGLNAVFDLWFLIGNSGVQMGDLRNDAAAFQQAVAPLIPASVWALLWALAAVLMLAAAVWFSLLRPASRSDSA
jgi:hypothetical protein